MLHVFLLWHESFCTGRVRLACDNVVVVDVINKRSIRGLTIQPLQNILLIAACCDIDLIAFSVPMEENMVSPQQLAMMAELRCKLKSFFKVPSLQVPDETTPMPTNHTNSSAAHGYSPFPASITAITHWIADIIPSVKPATAKSYVKRGPVLPCRKWVRDCPF